MLSKFWESTAQGLSERWLEQLIGPAFLFWGGGLLIIAGRIGFREVWNWIVSREIPTQSAMLIIGVLVITLSGRVMEQLRFTLLRFLEGYWGWPFRSLASFAGRFQRRRIERERDRWNILMDKQDVGTLALAEKRELSRLETRIHYTPADLDDCLPTTLGNILRAGESAPEYKYGLAAVVCWPRLWPLLPANAREDLSASRQRLDILLELWGWGLLFSVWAFLWPWAIAISVVSMLITYALMTEAARTYADLLEASFDLYRWDLYEATRWPLPEKNGKDELAIGRELSQFLWRGYTETTVAYAPPKK